jgi:hypothetical protein
LLNIITIGLDTNYNDSDYHFGIFKLVLSIFKKKKKKKKENSVVLIKKCSLEFFKNVCIKEVNKNHLTNGALIITTLRRATKIYSSFPYDVPKS